VPLDLFVEALFRKGKLLGSEKHVEVNGQVHAVVGLS
jgi:hypothetical protein